MARSSLAKHFLERALLRPSDVGCFKVSGFRDMGFQILGLGLMC